MTEVGSYLHGGRQLDLGGGARGVGPVHLLRGARR